jgi:acetyltransferase
VDAIRFFAENGVCVPRQRYAADADSAAESAADLRPPYVAKQLAHGVMHRSEIGLVRTDLADAAAVAAAVAAFQKIVVEHGLSTAGVIVAEQVSGLEMIVGGVWDRDFGPLVMVGAGGVLAEVLGDRTFARCPVDLARARDLVSRLRIGRVLAGYRNVEYDVDAFAQLIVRASEIFAASSWMAAFDLNPVLVGRAGAGTYAVDASVVVDALTR